MEDGRKILLYISLQARESTYSCSESPVTGTCQPSTNALHQDHNKVFLFITPSTGDGLRLNRHFRDAVESRRVANFICSRLSQRSQWQLVLLNDLAS